LIDVLRHKPVGVPRERLDPAVGRLPLERLTEPVEHVLAVAPRGVVNDPPTPPDCAVAATDRPADSAATTVPTGSVPTFTVCASPLE